jgi:hypothetical protein
LPKVILATANIAINSEAVSGSTVAIRYSAINAPIFGTVVKKMAAVPFAPSAASGTQKWAGTPPASNIRPATTPTSPAATAAAGASPRREARSA